MEQQKQIEEMATKMLIEVNRAGNEISFKNLATSLYNAGYRKQSGWISVEERLPPEEKTPILVTNGENVIVAYRNWLYRSNSTGELRCPANYGNGMNVTHWMPIPEPPKMKGGAE